MGSINGSEEGTCGGCVDRRFCSRLMNGPLPEKGRKRFTFRILFLDCLTGSTGVEPGSPTLTAPSPRHQERAAPKSKQMIISVD